MNTDAPSWLVDFLDGVSLWDALLWAAAIIAGAWFIYKRGWRTLVALARGIINSAETLAAVKDLPDFITRTDERFDRMEAKVEGIHHETHNNDGSSIKDAVDRIETSLEGVHGRLDTVEVDVRSLHLADDELRAELENTQNPKEP